MYRKLDELGEAVEDLDSRTMDMIGNRAKELNRDLEDILRRLQNMEFINYDKRKNTDEYALSKGYISIVPVQFDLTAHNYINELKNWKLND